MFWGAVLLAVLHVSCRPRSHTRVVPPSSVSPNLVERRLDALSPSSGARGRDVTLTLAGSGFVEGMRVFVGADEARSPQRTSAAALSAVFSTGGPGALSVSVLWPDGDRRELADAFTVLPDNSVSGRVLAGPVSAGRVRVFKLAADGSKSGAALNESTTDGAGGFALTWGSGSGAVLLEAGSGNYEEEADGTAVTLDGARTLTAILLEPRGERSGVVVSPYSTIAAAHARRLAASGAVLSDAAHNAPRLLAWRWGLAPWDFTTPSDLTRAPATALDPQSAEAQSAALLAGLSQYAVDAGADSLALAAALGADLAADAGFDGKAEAQAAIALAGGVLAADAGHAGLAAAIERFLAGPRNRSGLVASDFSSLLAAVRAAASSSVAAPAIDSVIPAEVPQKGQVTLRITGAGLSGADLVRVNGAITSITAFESTATFPWVEVTAPPGVHGGAELTVTGASTGLQVTKRNAFSYYDLAQLDNPPLITLLTPLGGEFLKGGASAAITWRTSAARASTITLYYTVDDGAPVTIATGESDDGKFTWQVPALNSSAVRVIVRATDTVGLTGEAQSPSRFTIDSSAPAPPSLTLAPGSDSGSSASDGVTNVAAPTFSLGGESGASIEISLNQGAWLTGTLDASGLLASLAAPNALTDGAHTLSAAQIDRAGNRSSTVTTLALIIDTVAPGAPTLVLAAASDTGASSSDGITSKVRPTVTGSTAQADLVRILENGQPAASASPTGAASSQNFSATLDNPLGEGTHSFEALAVDLAGNVSAASPVLTLVIDSTPPAVPADFRLAASSDTGASATDGITSDDTPEFSLSTEPGATVTLTSGAMTLASAVADSAGAATMTSSPLAEAAYQVRATVSDLAGNSATTSPIALVIDRRAPQVAAFTATIVPGARNDTLQLRFNEALDPADAVLAKLGLENPVGSARNLAQASNVLDAAGQVWTVTLSQSTPELTLSPGAFLLALASLRDLAGNVGAPVTLHGHVTGDLVAPALLASIPANGGGVALNHAWLFRAGEALDATTLSFGAGTSANVFLFESGGPFVSAAMTVDSQARTLLVRPSAPLANGKTYVLAVTPRVLDLSGNAFEAPDCVGSAVPCPQPATLVSAATQAADTQAPTITQSSPASGATGVARDAAISVTFSEAIAFDTVTTSTVTLKAGAASLSYAASFNDAFTVLTLRPTSLLNAATSYTVTLGAGVTDLAALALSGATPFSFTTAAADTAAPTISLLTVEDIPNTMNGMGAAGGVLALPSSGITLRLDFSDSGGSLIDPASLSLTSLIGGISTDHSAKITVGSALATWTIAAADALPLGAGAFSATIADGAGNRSPTATLPVEILAPSDAQRPFESSNTWFVDFDRDFQTLSISAGAGDTVTVSASDSPDGTADFDQDLRFHGLNIQGTGPTLSTGKTTNQTMRALVIDAIVERTSAFFGIGVASSGPVTSSESVAVEFVTTQPSGGAFAPEEAQKPFASFPYSRISVGGYGGDGVSGQAWFDRQNASQDNDSMTPVSDPVTATTLGVFVSSDFKFAVNLSASTRFRSTYDPLIPLSNRGNNPVGNDARDVVVLEPSFDFFAASAAEQARHAEIMDAVAVYAGNAAAVLAHEIGHSLGLVADGAPPSGLHGGNPTHFPQSTSHHLHALGELPAGAVNLMSPAQSLSERLHPGSRFTALSLAYLRQRVIVK